MNELMKAAFEKRLNELMIEIKNKSEYIDEVLSQYVNGERDLEDLPDGHYQFLLIGAVALYLIRDTKFGFTPHNKN